MNYQLVRSNRRKTVALQVKNGNIIVRAPSYLSIEQVDALIRKKSAWLRQKIADTLQQTTPEAEYFIHSSSIWFKGEQKELSISFGDKAITFVFEDKIQVVLQKRIQVKTNDLEYLKSQVKKQLSLWFKQQLECYILETLPILRAKTSLRPKSFKVRQYKARWGSCNNKAELSFNYLLMMVPTWVVDYVMIHEFCHLKHLNHSPDFWHLVETHMPNYKVAKQWLKTHQSQLIW